MSLNIPNNGPDISLHQTSADPTPSVSFNKEQSIGSTTNSESTAPNVRLNPDEAQAIHEGIQLGVANRSPATISHEQIHQHVKQALELVPKAKEGLDELHRAIHSASEIAPEVSSNNNHIEQLTSKIEQASEHTQEALRSLKHISHSEPALVSHTQPSSHSDSVAQLKKDTHVKDSSHEQPATNLGENMIRKSNLT